MCITQNIYQKLAQSNKLWHSNHVTKHNSSFVTPNTMQVLRVSKEMYNEAIYGEPAHKQEAIMESASNNCIAIA